MIAPDLFRPTAMPAITLWQPYASLVAVGAKRYETRHWTPPAHYIGIRIAIHAAVRRPTRADVAHEQARVIAALGEGWPEQVPYGAVLCTVLLTRCRTVSKRQEREVHFFDGGPVHEDDGFGDYAPRRKCWELTDLFTLPRPAPARGGQGWFTWQEAA